jgi:hypothetical protein
MPIHNKRVYNLCFVKLRGEIHRFVGQRVAKNDTIRQKKNKPPYVIFIEIFDHLKFKDIYFVC